MKTIIRRLRGALGNAVVWAGRLERGRHGLVEDLGHLGHAGRRQTELQTIVVRGDDITAQEDRAEEQQPACSHHGRRRS